MPRVERSFQTFAEMDLASAWKAEWFEIISDSEILQDDAFIPCTVEVKSTDASVLETMRVWKGLALELVSETKRKHEKKRSGRKRPAHQNTAGRKTARVRSSGGRGAVQPGLEDDGDAVASEAEDELWEGESAVSGDSLAVEEDDIDDDEQRQTTAGPANTALFDEWEKLAELAERHPTLDSATPSDPSAAGAGKPGSTPQAVAKAAGQGAAESKAAPKLRGSSAAAPARAKLVVEEVFEVRKDGVVIGHLSHNPRRETLTAHCRCVAKPHGDCRRQRTCKAGPRSSGRPIGHLVAWLLDAESWSSKDEHVQRSGASLSLSKREEARALFASHPGSDLFSRHERAREEGEPAEPVLSV